MDDQLGRDQRRQGDQEPDVHFHVVEEGKASNAPAKRGQEQERQPHNRCNRQYPAIQELLVVSLEMRSPQKLEQWTTENQGEIGRLAETIQLWHRTSAIVHQAVGSALYAERGYHTLTVGGLGSSRQSGVIAAVMHVRSALESDLFTEASELR